MLASMQRSSQQRSTESAKSSGSAAAGSLVHITQHFDARSLTTPSPAVALHCGGVQPSSSSPSEEAYRSETGRDAVLEKLRTLPLSLLRDSDAASFLPPPLKSLLAGGAAASRASPSPAASAGPSCGEAESRATLARTLSVLGCLLQRSPEALSKAAAYSRLLRMLSQHGFVARAVEDMRVLWGECAARQDATSDTVSMDAMAMLALYGDVLVLLACHCTAAERDAARSTSVGSSEAGAAAVQSFASATTLAALYKLSTEVGEAALRATAAPSSPLRRIVAAMTATLIHCAQQLPSDAVDAALRTLETDAAQRASMAHMAFIAALPHVCPSQSPEWQCRALEVVRRATLYDADVAVAFCAEGPSSVLLDVVTAQFGKAMRDLLAMMSESAWSYCTADALVHLCHAVGIYGATWSTYPESYISLINFLHRALVRQHARHAHDSSSATGHRGLSMSSYAPHWGVSSSAADHTSDIVQLNQRGGSSATTVRPLDSRALDALVSGAVLGSASAAAAEKAQIAAPSPERPRRFDEEPERTSAETDESTKGDGAAFLARCEADPRSPRSFLFYLSLFAYAAAALPPMLDSFEDLSLFFTLEVAEDGAAADKTSSTEAAAEAAPAPEPPKASAISLFALCAKLLDHHLATAVGPDYDPSSAEDKERRLLCESTLALLTTFMCHFPHSLQRLEEKTGCHDLVYTVTRHIPDLLRAPRTTLSMKQAAYTLLRRFASAVDSMGDVMALLLQPSNWSSLAAGPDVVRADYVGALLTYHHLCCTCEEAGAAELSRVVELMAELPAGVFSCAADGAALAAVTVGTVFALREVAVEERSLFAAVTVPQLPGLLSRLGEALHALTHAEEGGFSWGCGGAATSQSVELSVWLLHKAVSLYRVPASFATATFPVAVSPADSDGDLAAASIVMAAGGEEEEGTSGGTQHRPRSLAALCLALLCKEPYAAAHRELAELLVAGMEAGAAQRTPHSVFHVLRATTRRDEAARLRETLVAVQKANMGSRSNVLRLEVWLGAVRCCPEHFVFLFGPPMTDDEDDEAEEEEEGKETAPGSQHQKKAKETAADGKDPKAEGAARGGDGAAVAGVKVSTYDEKPEALPYALTLVATVRAKAASRHEKALALNVLRCSGLTHALAIKDVCAVFTKEVDAKGDGSDAAAPQREWEVAVLAAACVAYVNSAIAAQVAKLKSSSASSSASPATTAGAGAAEGTGQAAGRSPAFGSDARTPLPRPPLTPLLSPGATPATAGRLKLLGTFSDSMDQLLRHAPVVLEMCRRALERVSREADYQDVFEWVAEHSMAALASGEVDGLSSSVVLPRLPAMAQRTDSSGNSTMLGRPAVPTALATALSRAQRSAFSSSSAAAVDAAGRSNATTTAAAAPPLVPLLFLTEGQRSGFVPYERLAHVGPAETRYFRNTDDDARLNELAALLDGMTALAAAAEQLLWLGGADVNTAALFTSRTQAVLEAAMRAVVSSRPTSPLVAVWLTRHVAAQLRLAKAATGILKSSLGTDMMELEVTQATQSVLSNFVSFVKANRQHAFLLAEAVPIVTAFPLGTMGEQAAAMAFMRLVQASLHDQVALNRLEENAAVLDVIVEGYASYFSRSRTDSGSAGLDVVLLRRLLPTLVQYASLLSQRIRPSSPSCEFTRRFRGVLACLCSILSSEGKRVAVLAFLPQSPLLTLTRALGQFAVSATYDAAAHRHRRLSWHDCWQAVLSLWCVVASLQGPFSAKAAEWVSGLLSALQGTPRFATALGAFPGPHGADRQELLVWELEEVETATRLAAALAVQGVALATMLPSVQTGFLFLQQSRLQHRCVASQPTAEASVSDGRRIATAQANALRNGLTFLLTQPCYAIARNGASLAAFVFVPEVMEAAGLKPTATSAADAGGAVAGANTLVLSLDLLRQFTVRELQLLRRLSTSSATSGAAGASGTTTSASASLERSPEISRTGAGATTASRESSMTRSPSRGPLGDGETVTDTDELFAADGSAEDGVDKQAVHLETVQLVISAYILTVEELVTQAQHAPGGFLAMTVVQALRETTKRLQNTLHSLAREVRDLRRPLLRQILDAKTAQLDAVLAMLQC